MRGMSRRTKARPARLYKERKVARVEDFVVGDACIDDEATFAFVG